MNKSNLLRTILEKFNFGADKPFHSTSLNFDDLCKKKLVKDMAPEEP